MIRWCHRSGRTHRRRCVRLPSNWHGWPIISISGATRLRNRPETRRVRSDAAGQHARGLLLSLAVFAGLPLISGCRHRPATVYAPPAPVLLPAPAGSGSGAPTIASTAPIAPSSINPGVTSAADLSFVASHAPVWTETGTASWYGPPYNKRRGANGQIYDQDAMTAAHRTLPLNSLIRVTNVRTGQQAVLHVT